MSEIPPWELVELPSFQIDGQTYGGTASAAAGSVSMWGNWRGLSGMEQKKRPSTSSSVGPLHQPTRPVRFSSITSDHDVSLHSSPLLVTPRLGSIPSIPDPPVIEIPLSNLVNFRNGSLESSGSNARFDGIRKISIISATISENHADDSSASSPRLSGPVDSFDPHGRRVSALTQESHHSSMTPNQSRRDLLSFPQASQSARDRSDVEGQQAAEDDDWDLMRVLQQTEPPKSAGDRFAPAEGETVEFVQESMASYLNRKTALLMLWFPLGVSVWLNQMSCSSLICPVCLLVFSISHPTHM